MERVKYGYKIHQKRRNKRNKWIERIANNFPFGSDKFKVIWFECGDTYCAAIKESCLHKTKKKFRYVGNKKKYTM